MKKSVEVSCLICKKIYSSKGIHTHYERSHGSSEEKKKYSNGHNGKYKNYEFQKKITDTRNKNTIKNKGEYKNFEVKCSTCSKLFLKLEREFLFPQKEKYYCTRSCANSRIKTDEIKKRISLTLKTKNKIKKKETKIYKCLVCENVILTKGKKFCSKNCKIDFHNKDKTDFAVYTKKCKFDFSLNDFLLEFDFNLIERYGWYKAKNRGDNLKGVSRDHMISIKYGFEHNIEPEIIKHPANCRLMRHIDNFKKGTVCSITIEELINKIDIWNHKYGRSVRVPVSPPKKRLTLIGNLI